MSLRQIPVGLRWIFVEPAVSTLEALAAGRISITVCAAETCKRNGD